MKKDTGLDVLKLIATVAVVRLHTGFSDSFLDEILYYTSGIALTLNVYGRSGLFFGFYI